MNYTCLAIENTFMNLLKEKPLDKITVKEITETCQINRNTFYYHYRDIYALLQSIFEREKKKFINENNKNFQWRDGFFLAVQFAMENTEAIEHIYHSSKRFVVETYLDSIVETLMIKVLDEFSKGIEVSQKNKKYLVMIFKHTISGIVLEWLNNGAKDDLSEIIKTVTLVFGGSAKSIIKFMSVKD